VLPDLAICASIPMRSKMSCLELISYIFDRGWPRAPSPIDLQLWHERRGEPTKVGTVWGTPRFSALNLPLRRRCSNITACYFLSENLLNNLCARILGQAGYYFSIDIILIQFQIFMGNQLMSSSVRQRAADPQLQNI
jgi:hypothetical protein